MAMKHDLLQVARWALSASFAVMVAVACLPNPQPSLAWKIAEGKRHERRFPELRPSKDSLFEPDTQLANGNANQPDSPTPFRTAQRPPRMDAAPRETQNQEPILFFEEDEPNSANLAPDPAHLDLPPIAPR